VKAIKCFANSKDNKMKRLEEQEMANAKAVQSRRTRSLQNQQQQRGRQRQAPEYIDYTQFQQQQQHQHQQQKMNHHHAAPAPLYAPSAFDHANVQVSNVQVYRPPNPVIPPPPSNPAAQKLDMNHALSGLRFGRSKSVPPELRQHFAVYNMYGNENEEEKIMEYSTDNSITSSRKSLTAGTGSPSLPSQPKQRQPAMTADQRLAEFQSRIREIQNELANPPLKQISIEREQHPPQQQYQQLQQRQQPQYPQNKPQPMRHKLPIPRSKTPEPIRSSSRGAGGNMMDRFRSKTPEPRSSTSAASPAATVTGGVPTTIIRTQRYHAEKIVTPDGNIMLKKKIVHVNRTRSCVACGFREWSVDDMAYLLVRQQSKKSVGATTDENTANASTPTATTNQQVKWLCPDCACDNGLPQQHYHWNKNRLPPVADPVIDITMNRPIGPVDPEDIAWVQKAQRKPKAQNWKSQYSDYYANIRRKQRQKQAMFCAPPPPEEYSDSPEDEIRRAVANACYAPSYEQSDVGETCYNYVGDL